MPTRSELYHKEVTSSPATVDGHHIGFRILGVIILTLLMVSLIINRTILNKKFVMREATSSALESALLDEVDDGLAQYGISMRSLPKRDTDQIVRTVVNQAFAGQKLELDLSSVSDGLTSQANDQLAKYGLSTDILPSGASSAVTSELNGTVNSQLNSPEVTAVINGLQVARVGTNVVMGVTAIGLVVLIILAVVGRHLLTSMSWVTLLATILTGLVVTVLRGIIPQLATANPNYSTFAVQCASDFQQAALPYIIVLGLLAIACWVLRILRRFKRTTR